MTYRKFYLLSSILIILICSYPVYMGISTLMNYLQNDLIAITNYKKYIIPYTPISISLIAITLLAPVIIRLFKRFALFAASLLGTVLFFITEAGFEQIKVMESQQALPLESWQYSLCVATPQVLRSIGAPLYAENNPGYKVHFYIISLLIILSVLYVIFEYSKMLLTSDYKKKKLLTAQTISIVLFISLCIYACFTAFYRNGDIHIFPLSAILMTLFFIVFGVTTGIYMGSVFYLRKSFLSIILPAVTASLATLVMYIGELILMGGKLFIYGKGFLFQPIGAIPFSTVDYMIIAASGLITLLALYYLKRHKQS